MGFNRRSRGSVVLRRDGRGWVVVLVLQEFYFSGRDRQFIVSRIDKLCSRVEVERCWGGIGQGCGQGVVGLGVDERFIVLCIWGVRSMGGVSRQRSGLRFRVGVFCISVVVSGIVGLQQSAGIVKSRRWGYGFRGVSVLERICCILSGGCYWWVLSREGRI